MAEAADFIAGVAVTKPQPSLLKGNLTISMVCKTCCQRPGGMAANTQQRTSDYQGMIGSGIFGPVGSAALPPAQVGGCTPCGSIPSTGTGVRDDQ